MTWRDNAACEGEDTNIFFSKSPSLTDQARAICNTCPVSQECLEDAMAWEADGTYYRYGMFGGFTKEERRELA